MPEPLSSTTSAAAWLQTSPPSVALAAEPRIAAPSNASPLIAPPELMAPSLRSLRPASLHAMGMSHPDTVLAGTGQWRATVMIDSNAPGHGTVPKRCEFPQSFSSREAALQYAIEQCRLQAARPPSSHIAS